MNAILETIALLTIAVAALELGQTIIEEEVQRQALMSAPTRVRRFLSRFMIVLVVSLTIEVLVMVFQFSHDTTGTPALCGGNWRDGGGTADRMGGVYSLKPECGGVGA